MQGKLVIFSAPSGAGKTTIVQYLLKKIPNLEFSVSACSRAKRAGETHGVDYYFISVEEFKQKIKNEEFAEWEEVYKDNFYGTLKAEIERIRKKGHHIIFDMDVVGGINLKKQFGDQALAVFVMPPSIEHLEERLKSRETETPESIARRIGKAEVELLTSHQFDTVILNDSLEHAFAEAEKAVKAFLGMK
ncbi:MAG TPA: guanylate kinase [Bacteroidia bacterium]|jgi:guanylate kinase|nr:guanylate kinase [Bacteroidia bacterium]